MNGTPTQTLDPEATVQIETLDNFVRLLAGWHQARVNELEALFNIPEGVEISLDDSEPIMLEGAVRLAFIAGVNVALMKLGVLPFQAEVEDEASVN